MTLEQINGKYPNIGLITFTSDGYTDLTKNLSTSIKQNNVDLKLNIFCLDSKSFSTNFGKNTNKVNFFDNKNQFQHLKNNEMMRQDSEFFGDLMFKKFELIYESLQSFEFVIYIDSDIVVKKNFIEQIFYDFQYKDIAFQNDKRPSKPNEINLCAGFMLIRSNKKMNKFFDPLNIPIEKFKKFKTHDQTYINKSKSKFNYNILPLETFPNGPKYYEDYMSIDPSIVHFNYVRGEEKIELMKKYSEWYI
jgi:hypothetical protein